MDNDGNKVVWTVVIISAIAIIGLMFINFMPSQTANIKTAISNELSSFGNGNTSDSSGSKSSSHTAVGTNLVTGTDQEYVMGFDIPNTTWDDGYAYEKLPITDTPTDWFEILPQDPHTFYYTLTKGTTYTQTIWFETDATVKDLNAAQITWFTYGVGHDGQPARVQKLGQNSYKLVSTYTWPGKTDNNVRLFDISYLNSAFDLNTGTYLKFGNLKLEKGSVSTPYIP